MPTGGEGEVESMGRSLMQAHGETLVDNHVYKCACPTKSELSYSITTAPRQCATQDVPPARHCRAT